MSNQQFQQDLPIDEFSDETAANHKSNISINVSSFNKISFEGLQSSETLTPKKKGLEGSVSSFWTLEQSMEDLSMNDLLNEFKVCLDSDSSQR